MSRLANMHSANSICLEFNNRKDYIIKTLHEENVVLCLIYDII